MKDYKQKQYIIKKQYFSSNLKSPLEEQYISSILNTIKNI